MAYVQADLDGMKRAQSAAGLLKIPPPQVMGGLTFMWSHCRLDHVDRVSRIQVEGFFWSSEPRLVEALVAFGFLEPAGEDAWRVKGLDRYNPISEAEREARRKGGLAAKGNLRRGTAAGGTQVPLPGCQPGPAGDFPGSASRGFSRLTPAPLSEIRDPRSEIRLEEDTSPPAARVPTPLQLDQQAILEALAQATGKSPKFDRGDYAIVGKALKTFSRAELLQAVAGVVRDPWPERRTQDGPAFIFGTAAQVRKFMALAPKSPTPIKPKEDILASLAGSPAFLAAKAK